MSVRRSLSAILAFGPVAPGSGRDGVEAYQSFVVAPAGAAVEGHRDGRFAEAQREAIGHRRGARSTVVGQAGRAGVRTLGRRLGTSVGAETPGSPSIPAASQGGRSWLGRSSCSPAQRGCLRGVRRGECGRSLPNGWLQQTNRPLRGLARVARIAVEPCVRQKNRRNLGHDHREPYLLWREVGLPCPGASTSGAGRAEGAPL